MVLVLTATIRIHLLDVPFERDEGEYAYAGGLILEGIPPFLQAYNMKMPGIYAGYAADMALFGSTRAGIRGGILILNALTAIFLYQGFKRRLDRNTAFWGAAGFSIISLTPAVQGFIANAEHFVLVFASAGWWLLLKGIDRRRNAPLLLSGLLFGIAYMMKQHGALLILGAGAYLLYDLYRQGRLRQNRPSILFFTIGVFTPFLLSCWYLRQVGVFDRFWFWTFDYAREYVTINTFSRGLHSLYYRLRDMFFDFPLFLGPAALGLLVPIWDPKAKAAFPFLFPFVLFSFLATVPGLYFRPHYFILMLPAVSLMAGVAVDWLSRLPRGLSAVKRSRMVAGFFILAVCVTLLSENRLFFRMTPVEISRELYEFAPFPESIPIGRFLADHSQPQDLVGVLGSEPQIYVYARRKAATGYMYTFALMEDQKFARDMGEEFIREIEASAPEFLVYVNVSWQIDPSHPSYRLVDWAKDYLAAHYTRVGVVDIQSLHKTVYLWEEDARDYTPRSIHWLGIYRRNS